MRNLRAAAFPGPIYPVNPSATTIQSLPAFASVADIPGSVDLAIIAVPSMHVLGVAEQSGRKGVHALIVLTAGFGEIGPEGQQRQAELLRICRSYGMRLVGPNCIGAINTDPAAPLNATFGPLMPPPGRIGMATQSGAHGLELPSLSEATQARLRELLPAEAAVANPVVLKPCGTSAPSAKKSPHSWAG